MVLGVSVMRRRREAAALLEAGGPVHGEGAEAGRGDVELHAFDRGIAPLVPSVEIDTSNYEAPQSTSTRARYALQALGRKFGGALAGASRGAGERAEREGGGCEGGGNSGSVAAGGGGVNPAVDASASSQI